MNMIDYVNHEYQNPSSKDIKEIMNTMERLGTDNYQFAITFTIQKTNEQHSQKLNQIDHKKIEKYVNLPFKHPRTDINQPVNTWKKQKITIKKPKLVRQNAFSVNSIDQIENINVI